MRDFDMIEQIARHLCEADGHDPKIIGMVGNPSRETYMRTAWNMIPLLVKAWEEGHEVAAMRVPEGVWHDTASPRTPNPYRQETGA